MTWLKILSALASIWQFVKAGLVRREIEDQTRTKMDRDNLQARIEMESEGNAMAQDAEAMSDEAARAEADPWVRD